MEPCLILRVRARGSFGCQINSWETKVIFHSREVGLEKWKVTKWQTGGWLQLLHILESLRIVW